MMFSVIQGKWTVCVLVIKIWKKKIKAGSLGGRRSCRFPHACTRANTELKERGGTIMGGLRKAPWSSKDVRLGAERAAVVKNKNSVKTHLVLQKDLSDRCAFLLLRSNSNHVTAVWCCGRWMTLLQIMRDVWLSSFLPFITTLTILLK